MEHVHKVVNIAQSPIGRNSRSNPATYTGLFTPIRDLYSMLPESRERGYKPGRFSFNVKGGRCEKCQGDGLCGTRRPHSMDKMRDLGAVRFSAAPGIGAMRSDLEMMRHVDGHFLSDTVNPTNMLHITQGAWLRLPPGRIGHWAVVRSVERAVPEYRRTVADSPATILVPSGAGWYPTESVGLDFALLAAMPGMLGFSGDFTRLNHGQRARIAEAIAFFKKWRRFITGSVGHLLTPPASMACREGWIAFQLQGLADDTSLVFVYGLHAPGAPPPLRLCGLRPEIRYDITPVFDANGKPVAECDGARLMRDGLPRNVAHGGAWIVQAR